MTLDMFLTCLAVTAGVVIAALAYLRRAARRVAREFCESDAAADFWLRSADVLAVSGSLILVLTFGMRLDGIDWLQALRLSVGLALAGLFVSVMFISSRVWRSGIGDRGPRSQSLPPGPSP